MSAPGAPDTPTVVPAVAPAARRRTDRRIDARIADLSLPELRRLVVTTAIAAAVAALFVWMVRDVLVAGILGTVTAVYLRPLYRWLEGRLQRRTPAALVALAAIALPLLLAAAYAYAEVLDVATYVRENQAAVAERLQEGLSRLGLHEIAGARLEAREWVTLAGGWADEVQRTLRGSLGHGAVATTVFVFTAVYVLTHAPAIGAYARLKVPARLVPLAAALEHNVRDVLYGALYGTLVTQVLKSAVILALNLVLGVPLAGVLALLSFVLGFFPIVGSWSVYVPVAAWLFVFRDAPVAALAMLVIGFLVNTVFLSMYLRPKLAAERSQVLDFYWMFLGIVTGVYAFGVAGLVLGPVLIALLKAVVDALGEPASWPAELDDDDAPGALAEVPA